MATEPTELPWTLCFLSFPQVWKYFVHHPNTEMLEWKWESFWGFYPAVVDVSGGVPPSNLMGKAWSPSMTLGGCGCCELPTLDLWGLYRKSQLLAVVIPQYPVQTWSISKLQYSKQKLFCLVLLLQFHHDVTDIYKNLGVFSVKKGQQEWFVDVLKIAWKVKRKKIIWSISSNYIFKKKKSSLYILVHWSIFERDGKVVVCVQCAKNALKIHHSPAICLGRQSPADEKTQR